MAKGETPPGQDGDARLLSAGYTRGFVFVMFLVCAFNFGDRAVFSVTAEAIKHDLALSDFELGLLQGFAFALLYSVLGVPIGRLAERRSRVRIIAAATAFWSAATSVCGFAGSFLQMLLARVGVGMGEAGFSGPMVSLVGDHFPPRKRASATALIMLGTPLGSLFGALVGGWVAQHYGWRSAFLVLGLPGLAVALLVATVLREPRRGLADGLPPAQRTPPPLSSVLRTLVQRRALRYIVLGGALAGIGGTPIATFMPVFLSRVHGLPTAAAGAWFGIISAISLSLSFLLSAFGTDWAGQKDRRWSAWAPAISFLIAPPMYFVALNADSLGLSLLFLAFGGLTLMFFYSPTLGMLQNLVAPDMRASTAAIFSMLFTLIGFGLGPALLGLASDRFAQAAFAGDFFAHCPGGIAAPGSAPAVAEACRAAAADGIRQSLFTMTLVLFVSALLFFRAAASLKSDLVVPPEAPRSPA